MMTPEERARRTAILAETILEDPSFRDLCDAIAAQMPLQGEYPTDHSSHRAAGVALAMSKLPSVIYAVANPDVVPDQGPADANTVWGGPPRLYSGPEIKGLDT